MRGWGLGEFIQLCHDHPLRAVFVVVATLLIALPICYGLYRAAVGKRMI